jgi:cyclomaltodextrinase
LKAGISDTIPVSDLFFAEKYDPEFETHPDIDISYDSKTQQVIFTPHAGSSGLTLVHFTFQSRNYSIPVKISWMHPYTFKYKPAYTAKQLTVFGSFNSWNRAELPLTDPDGDGIFQCTVNLQPGRYEYKFFMDGEEILDPSNPDKVPNPFGSYNSLLTIKSPQAENARFYLLKSWQKTDTTFISFAIDGVPSGFVLDKENILALFNNTEIPAANISTSGNKFTLFLPGESPYRNGLLRTAIHRNNVSTRFENIPFRNGRPRSGNDVSFNWHDAIIYAIMVDRFFDGDSANTRPVPNPEVDPKANFHGGDLQGILDKLEEGYFTDLGVNVLWLSPINQNTFHAFREYPPPHRYFTGYHGYWPIDPYQVDVRFGDMKLFKKLVKKAHSLGIKVILDFVANHVHQEHIYYKEHPEWFGTFNLPDGRKNIRLWDEYRLTTWFDTFLPSFDYQGSREAREVMTDNAVWWMKTSGIDGFRQDAVKHVPNSFWRLLTRKLKENIELKENRQIFQIGETFGGYDLISSYVNNGQLNAQFNFNLYDVALNVFLTPGASFRTLDDEMNKTFEVYGGYHLMGNLMDSHDKVRYMAYADGDLSLSTPDAAEVGWENPPQVDDSLSYQKTRLYLTYLLSIPGVPVIYYGDEIGMTGAADPDNRRPMRFGDSLNGQERKMLAKVKLLVRARRDHSALRQGDFICLQADQNIYAFVRSDLNERILVVLNKSSVDRKTMLVIPAGYGIRMARDIKSGERIRVMQDSLLLDMPAISGRIFSLEN